MDPELKWIEKLLSDGRQGENDFGLKKISRGGPKTWKQHLRAIMTMSSPNLGYQNGLFYTWIPENFQKFQVFTNFSKFFQPFKKSKKKSKNSQKF
jgi:hypothetical protein